jgi:hypothetical protein
VHFLSLPLSIVALVFWCMHLHRLWSAIPESGRSTTPGKAVGFLFIPFFSFYWYFRSYVGLVQDASKVTGRPGPAGLAMTYAILSVVKWVVIWFPVVSTLFFIGYYVVWLLFALAATKQANAVLEAQAGSKPAAHVPPPIPQPVQA